MPAGNPATSGSGLFRIASSNTITNTSSATYDPLVTYTLSNAQANYDYIICEAVLECGNVVASSARWNTGSTTSNVSQFNATTTSAFPCMTILVAGTDYTKNLGFTLTLEGETTGTAINHHNSVVLGVRT